MCMFLIRKINFIDNFTIKKLHNLIRLSTDSTSLQALTLVKNHPQTSALPCIKVICILKLTLTDSVNRSRRIAKKNKVT